MKPSFQSIAQHMWNDHIGRKPYSNLPDSLAPASISDAYAAQEAYWRLAEPVYGSLAGVKVATTTKVMQQLMNITHPCGGGIFSKTIHTSPARIAKADFVNLRLESEIALQLATDMPIGDQPFTADSVVPFVAGARAAYELIEDRNAIYTETKATSMIVNNCWNAGVVLGELRAVKPAEVTTVRGRQTINGQLIGEGQSENPFATLAWLANLLAERQRSLKAGMIVITGSIVPTFSIQPGDHAVFRVDGLGEVVMDIA
jgi:2-oxo-3-hexenedioate decarboxylase/2-keto-4-pentenoate hydratase